MMGEARCLGLPYKVGNLDYIVWQGFIPNTPP
jgi:hypothetical protein